MKAPSNNKRMVLYILNKALEYIEEVEDFSHKISEQDFYNNKGKVPETLLSNLDNISLLIGCLKKYNPFIITTLSTETNFDFSVSRKKIIKEENTFTRDVWKNIENLSKVKTILFQEFDFS